MKTTALNALLDECRGARTSDDLAAAVGKVEAMAATVRAERAKLEGRLQDVILAGKDTGKVHTAIADLDQQLRDLEAAQTGFSQRKDELAKQEMEATRAALLKRYALETEQLAASGQRQRAMVDALLQEAMTTEKLVRQHNRTRDELESLGERRLPRAAAVLRDNIGELPAPSTRLGLSEYGKQAFTKLREFLQLNPGNLLRARLTRRQNGRLGESFEAKDHATEAFMEQVRGLRARS